MKQTGKVAWVLALFLIGCGFDVDSKSFTKTNSELLGDIALLANIYSGANSSTPEEFTANTNYAFFSAYNATVGSELYYTDGTTTTLVQDICGGCDATPTDVTITSGGVLFFMASDSTHGRELWSGSQLGVSMVVDYTSGSGGTDLREITALGSYVYFSVPSGATRVLYRSNGTGASQVGTVEMPTHLKVIGSYLYFLGYESTHGAELWRTDGTTTQMVADINSGSASSSPREIVEFDGNVYFLANDGSHGEELYMYDGSTASLVTDIIPGSGTPFGGDTSPQLTPVGSRLFFNADNGSNANEELWSWDGSSASVVTDICVGSCSSRPRALKAVGSNAVYFSANDGSHGTELWMSYADSAAAVLVKDINSGASSANPAEFVAVGNGLYFRATSGSNTSLWLADAHGAKELAASTFAYPLGYFEKTGQLLFGFNDGTNGIEPWVMDAKRPAKLTDGSGNYIPVSSKLTVMGGVAYFAGGVSDNELYKTDGVTVSLVKDIRTGANSSDPDNFVVAGSTLYFFAEDSTHGRELYLSDGTSVGTTIAADMNVGGSGSDPLELVALGSTLYFTADTGGGRTLWSYDTSGGSFGTIVGTNVSPRSLVVAANKVFFLGTDANGEELWAFDPTGGSASRISQIGSGALDALITEMVSFNSQLYFVAVDATNGQQIFRSNGTGTVTSSYTTANAAGGGVQPANLKVATVSTGTFLFFNGNVGSGFHAYKLSTSSATSSAVATGCDSAYGFTSISNRAYFSCYDATNGAELWRSNTSGASGALWSDVNVGSGGSDLVILGTVNSRTYFSATDGLAGRELLYVTSGAPGSASQHDLVEGPGDSDPSDLVSLTTGAAFVADDGINGRIVWSVDNL